MGSKLNPKNWPWWVWVLLIVILCAVIAIILLAVFEVGAFGDSSCPTDTCPDCKMGSWREVSSNSFKATNECCGSVTVGLLDNVLTIEGTSSVPAESEGTILQSNQQNVPGIDQNIISFQWDMSKTVRNNETLTMEFTDTGVEYGGCGIYDTALFRAKPTDETTTVLWTTPDNPTYLPYYLSRAADGQGLCVFADAGGAPIEITVTSSGTKWQFFSSQSVKLYSYSGNTVQSALESCSEKWRELYNPGPAAEITDDLIVGNVNAAQVNADQTRGNSLASHYILTPSDYEFTDTGPLVDQDTLNTNHLSKVFIPLSAKQIVNDGNQLTLDETNGFYAAEEANTFYLDYDNSNIGSIIDSIDSNNQAGFLLTGGAPISLTVDKCPKYFYCQQPDLNQDSDICVTAQFGEGKVYQKQNLYDSSRRSVLSEADPVIETTALPGTGQFYLDNLDLTQEDLLKCYHSIVNLRNLGINSVLCNMCAGTQPNTEELKSLCFKWSQLSFLMPHIIFSGETDLTEALATNADFEGLRTNIAKRKQLLDKLSATQRPSLEQNNGFPIGEDIFMVVKLDEEVEVQSTFPSGEWSSLYKNSDGNYLHINSDGTTAQTISYEEDIESLIYFRQSSIYVFNSQEDPVLWEMNIVELDEDWTMETIQYTFTAGDHTTAITYTPRSTSLQIDFAYTAGADAIDPASYKLSKMTILYTRFHWSVNVPEYATVEQMQGDSKYAIIIDYRSVSYTQGDRSLLESWDQGIDNQS